MKKLTCKYCKDTFSRIDELQMHEINCKCNPYYHTRQIDKNNYVFPIHVKGVDFEQRREATWNYTKTGKIDNRISNHNGKRPDVCNKYWGL